MKHAAAILIFVMAAVLGALVAAWFREFVPVPASPVPASHTPPAVAVPSSPPAGPGASLRLPVAPPAPEPKAFPPPPAPRRPPPERQNPDAIADEYVLSFYDNRDRDTFIQRATGSRVQVLDRMDFAHAVRVRARDGADLKAVLDGSPIPVHRDVNYTTRSPERPGVDMRVPEGQYQGFGRQSLSFLGVPDDNLAWGKGVTVAVLDTGVFPHVALLEANIARVDLVGEKEEQPDEHAWHGTAVASLIAGNSPDLRGVAPAASLLDVKVMSSQGRGDAYTLAKGIVEAADRGARVINICLGTYGDILLLRQAVDYARQRGAVVVASAGNDALDTVTYPAAYEGVVTVSGVDGRGQPLIFANRGPAVDIAAPGIGVVAAWKDNSAALFTGTSAATPFVSGALAWLLASDPGLKPDEAVQWLGRCANDAGLPGPDPYIGAGILSVRRLQDRNIPGIYDVAVGYPLVLPVKPGDKDLFVVVYVQNRGTEPLAAVDLTFQAGQSAKSVVFSDLAVGETKSHRFGFDLNVLRAKAVEISLAATIRGRADAYPADNTRSVKLSPVVQE